MAITGCGPPFSPHPRGIGERPVLAQGGLGLSPLLLMWWIVTFGITLEVVTTEKSLGALKDDPLLLLCADVWDHEAPKGRSPLSHRQ
jgi:hypothetical protein